MALAAGCASAELPSVPPLDDGDASTLDGGDRDGDDAGDPPLDAALDARMPSVDVDAAMDEDAGWPVPDDPSPECRPLVDGWIEVRRHADARYLIDDTPFGTPVSAALTWRVPEPGLYAIELRHFGFFSGPFVRVHAGRCEGPPIDRAPTPPEASQQVVYPLAEGEITFVVAGLIERGTIPMTRIELTARRMCDRTDPLSCLALRNGETSCGVVKEQLHYGGEVCEPLDAPGEVDERCPDTSFMGERVEGCCRPSGECGHIDADEELGCSERAMFYWAYAPEKLVFYCDERATADAPEYFVPGRDGDPCETPLDCRSHPSYGNGYCIEGECQEAEP